ncbi:M50 family metallopeptidase [Arcanobacterium bovis]|uniref:RIP metalloprotease n=1 Tax=Arcanobacterium bovis TaxID=2529275 RepID=A0A4Q9V0W4_9ACTO|nr:M50 family metallopeptidase [Arcanobacterium bovis]TBW22720.1 RIP metalloprotease [Arcanobacterium bovis]
MILGILIFIFGLLVTVGLHELGHLLPAKKFGVKVPQYFIGFGPTLWSRTVNGTEYGIKAILLGGYVSLAGMLAPAKAGTKTTNADGSLTPAEEARRESAAELEPGEEHRAFWKLPAHKKLVVMFGGPFVNLLLAIVCLGIVFSFIGVPVPSSTISRVAMCTNGVESCDIAEQSPAYRAGIQPGDTVLRWGDTAVTNWDELYKAIGTSGIRPYDVELLRSGRKLTLSVTPVVKAQNQSGQHSTSAQEQSSRPFVGISPQIVKERRSLSELPQRTADLAWQTAKIVVALPVKLWQTGRSLFTGESRDPQGVVGIVGIADLAGSITATDNKSYGFADRLGDMLMLMGSLNMSLFIFNMIPLLPLDGGHILGALIEGVRRRIARVRGKPDPGAFDTARLLPLSNIVIVFFVGMTLLLVVADIVNPIR